MDCWTPLQSNHRLFEGSLYFPSTHSVAHSFTVTFFYDCCVWRFIETSLWTRNVTSRRLWSVSSMHNTSAMLARYSLVRLLFTCFILTLQKKTFLCRGDGFIRTLPILILSFYHAEDRLSPQEWFKFVLIFLTIQLSNLSRLVAGHRG